MSALFQAAMKLRSLTLTAIASVFIRPCVSAASTYEEAAAQSFTPVYFPVPGQVLTALKVMDTLERKDEDLFKPQNYRLEIQEAFRAVLGFQGKAVIPDASDFANVKEFHLRFVRECDYEREAWGYRQLTVCRDENGRHFSLPSTFTPAETTKIVRIINDHLRSPDCSFDAMLAARLKASSQLLPLPPELDQYVFLVLLGYAAQFVLFVLDDAATGDIKVPQEGNTFAQAAYNRHHEHKDAPYMFAVDYVLGFARRCGLLAG